MTAGNKVDLLVKGDGSTEVLIAPKVEDKEKSKLRRGQLCFVILTFLLIICLTGFLVFFFIHKDKMESEKYIFHAFINDKSVDGELLLNREHHTEIFRCGTVEPRYPTTISDGKNQMSAVIVQVDSGLICLIRDDKAYGVSVPPNFPRKEEMEILLNKTDEEPDMQVVMDDIMWRQDSKSPVDPVSLPESLRMHCSGLSTYKMFPWRLDFVEDTPEDKQDEEKGFIRDYINLDYDSTKDDYLYRKERAAPQEEERQEPAPANQALNLGESQSDHGLNCCHHCTKPYALCRRLCIDLERRTYPYYYRACDYDQCEILFPCSFWVARALGAA